MDDTLNKEENAKNIYVIRRKLAELKKVPGRYHYEYRVGCFILNIFTSDIQDVPDDIDNILLHTSVNIVLNEVNKSNETSSISLRDDSRFKYYGPIQYSIIHTPNGTINLSNGSFMPIANLCELIRYLHRLSNLTAFM